MGRETASLKEKLHRLIDDLPASELPAAERFLEYLRDRPGDPVLRALREAPEDDEPETPEEASAVQEAREDVAAGRLIPHEEARRRLLEAP